MSDRDEKQMKQLPKCSECGCPIFKQAVEDGLYKIMCGCRNEFLREGEDMPEVWANND